MQFLLPLLLAAQISAAADSPPPNVVLIVSDDQGYHDLGAYGSTEVLTPRLDQLAAEGVRFTDFYVTWPACTPSRGSLLTGRYPQRNGVYDMIRNEAPDYGHRYSPSDYEATFERIGGMDTREILLPAMLSSRGYVSGIFGKWDLGSLKRYLPTSRGFNDFYGFVNTGIDYFTHERYGVPSMYRRDQPTTEDRGTYATTLFAREAVRFVQQHHNRPFFLYLPFNAPHGASNLDPQIRTAAQATDDFKRMYPELQEQARFIRKDFRYQENALVHNAASKRLEYVAAVTCMDEAIGQVLDQLDEHGVADNTVVIFLSDNGGSGASDNAPLRGRKRTDVRGWNPRPLHHSLPRPAAARVCLQSLPDSTRNRADSSRPVRHRTTGRCRARRPRHVAVERRRGAVAANGDVLAAPRRQGRAHRPLEVGRIHSGVRPV